MLEKKLKLNTSTTNDLVETHAMLSNVLGGRLIFTLDTCNKDRAYHPYSCIVIRNRYVLVLNRTTILLKHDRKLLILVVRGVFGRR